MVHGASLTDDPVGGIVFTLGNHGMPVSPEEASALESMETARNAQENLIKDLVNAMAGEFASKRFEGSIVVPLTTTIEILLSALSQFRALHSGVNPKVVDHSRSYTDYTMPYWQLSGPKLLLCATIEFVQV